MTPNAEFFAVAHYDKPEIAAERWRLDIEGLADRPRALTLEALKARAHHRFGGEYGTAQQYR